jgi:hypothetical protein
MVKRNDYIKGDLVQFLIHDRCFKQKIDRIIEPGESLKKILLDEYGITNYQRTDISEHPRALFLNKDIQKGYSVLKFDRLYMVQMKCYA